MIGFEMSNGMTHHSIGGGRKSGLRMNSVWACGLTWMGRLFCLCCVVPAKTQAVDFRAEVYNEPAVQALNSGSSINPNNLQSVNQFQYFLRGDLDVKSALGEHANAFIKLEGQFYPASFLPSGADGKVFIKAMHLDFSSNFFSLRVGKQYVQWGSSVFFFPIDVINTQRDPLRPLEEAEGSPMISLSFPIKENASIDLLTYVRSDALQNLNKSISDLPVLLKVAFSANQVSGFVFAQYRDGTTYPRVGLNLDVTFSIGESLSLGLYGDLLYKYQSDRQKVAPKDGALALVPIPGNHFVSFVVGAKAVFNFSQSSWLDSMQWTVEYSQNSENWVHNDLLNYYLYLHFLESDLAMRMKTVALKQEYRNAPRYLFASVALQSLLTEDFEFRLSNVLNLEDFSSVLIPALSYSFENQNATVGLRVYAFLGDPDSEYGNSPIRGQVQTFFQYYF